MKQSTHGNYLLSVPITFGERRKYTGGLTQLHWGWGGTGFIPFCFCGNEQQQCSLRLCFCRLYALRRRVSCMVAARPQLVMKICCRWKVVHSCRNARTPAQTREEGSLESKFYTTSKPSIYNICFVWYLHRIYLKTKVPLVAKGSRCVFCNLLPKSKLRKEKREVQLLQHGEHGVQILQVNPPAIKLKVFNSDGWDCSWLFLISTIAWHPNGSGRIQPSWSVPLPVTYKGYVGTARRPTLGQAWEMAEAGLVWGLCCRLLQINWVVQATKQLDPAAQFCLAIPPHCSFL